MADEVAFGFHPYADVDEVDTTVSRITRAAAGREAEQVISQLSASDDALWRASGG